MLSTPAVFSGCISAGTWLGAMKNQIFVSYRIYILITEMDHLCLGENQSRGGAGGGACEDDHALPVHSSLATVSSPWKHIPASLSTGCLFYFSPLNGLKALCPEGQKSAPEGQRSACRDCMMTWSILSLSPPTRRMSTVLALSGTGALHSMQSFLLTARWRQKCHFIPSSQNIVPPTAQLCLSIIKAYLSAWGEGKLVLMLLVLCFVLF